MNPQVTKRLIFRSSNASSSRISREASNTLQTKLNSVEQLEFLKQIEKKLQIQQPADWYNYGKREVSKSGGGTLLRFYSNSICEMLKALYPENEWDMTRSNVNYHREVDTTIRFKDYSSKILKQLSILKSIEKRLNIQQPTEWYQYGYREILKNGGLTLLKYHYNSSPYQMLKSLYPEIQWDVTK
jgi:hypothetical protein